MLAPGIEKLISGFISLLYFFSFVLAIILIIYLAIQYMIKTSEKDIQKTHQKLLLLLIGYILVLFSFGITKVIRLFFH